MNEMDSRAAGQDTEPTDIGYEQPTEAAVPRIYLVPVSHQGKRGWITALAGRSAKMARRPTSASNDMPSQAAYLTVALEPSQARSDTILAALYLEAEQARLPHEPPYDVDRGLKRFSAWLDRQREPSASEELPTAASELIIELISA
jgi:hypothetical protein